MCIGRQNCRIRPIHKHAAQSSDLTPRTLCRHRRALRLWQRRWAVVHAQRSASGELLSAPLRSHARNLSTSRISPCARDLIATMPMATFSVRVARAPVACDASLSRPRPGSTSCVRRKLLRCGRIRVHGDRRPWQLRECARSPSRSCRWRTRPRSTPRDSGRGFRRKRYVNSARCTTDADGDAVTLSVSQVGGLACRICKDRR
jgi:hypothetical protein